MALAYTFIFLATGLVYYQILAKKFDAWFLRLSLKLNLFPGKTVQHVDALVNIVVAGLFQFAVLVVLLFFFPIPLNELFWDNFKPIQLALGLLLGLAHLVSSNLLGTIVLFGLKTLGGSRIKAKIEGANKMSGSGWINSFKMSAEGFGMPLMLTVTLFYITTEEVIFRGIILFSYLQLESLSIGIAITLASTLFILAQRSGMPSLLHAVYPMSSAATMAFIHCYLIVSVHSLIPLIIAHYTYFLFSTIAYSKLGTPAKDNQNISLNL